MSDRTPIRTCIGCGAKKEKNDLLRVGVREGRPVLDSNKSLSGRGAYICAREQCVSLLLKRKGRLGHVLRISLSRKEEEIFCHSLFGTYEGNGYVYD